MNGTYIWDITVGRVFARVKISFSYISVYIVKNNHQLSEPSKRKWVYIVDKYLKV